MPKVSEMYPSRWMSAADLLEEDLTLTIDRIETETIGDDDKWVVYFKEVNKGLVLNKTNTKTIAGLYGDETDDWEGQKVALYPTWVDFQGKSVEAIRIRPKAPRAAKGMRSNRPPAETAAKQPTAIPSDDIPF